MIISFPIIKNKRQKCKTDPLTFTLFHFSSLIFSFVNSVLKLSIFVNAGLCYNLVSSCR